MNPNAQFERDLEQWLQTEAPARAPEGFHATVIDRARTLRQRPGWTTTLRARRFGRGRGMTLLSAAALLLVGGALAAGSGLVRLPSVVPPLPAPSVFAVTTASPAPSASAAPSPSPIPVAGPGGVWIATGMMTTPSFDHIAVRLADGRVLVAGGADEIQPHEGETRNLTSAALYDPASGTWSPTGNMLNPQAGFPPTLLRDGRVLVGDLGEAAADVSTIGAELYDPHRGTWTATGPMVRGAVVWGADFGSTATLLRDGKVLVAGQGGAQLYDPASDAWSATGTMKTPRHSHTATLLRDGRVLVAGGSDGGDRPPREAELFDPDTGSWTAIANPIANMHWGGWTTLLQDGTLLFIRDDEQGAIYDPTRGTWSALAAPPDSGTPRALLPDDSLVMTRLRDPAPCTAAALYDPRSGSWTTTSSMLRCDDNSSFTPLLDGTVLVAGGRDCVERDQSALCVATSSAQLYVPAGVSLPPFSFPPPTPPVFPSPTPVPTPLPPAAGPVPPNARSWTVTVDNKSSEPAALFVAEEGEGGTLQLVGSATPNVVPARTSVKVTFLFPAKGGPDGWIYVNPRPGEGGSLVHAADIGIPGKIVITTEGTVGWLSP